jgi:hypothetical protein
MFWLKTSVLEPIMAIFIGFVASKKPNLDDLQYDLLL